jgi:hypothetical protein
MKIGRLRQVTRSCCPGFTGDRSISTGAPAAITSADGFIESINGQIAAAVPTTPSAPETRNRKSRRVSRAPLGCSLLVVMARISPWRPPLSQPFVRRRSLATLSMSSKRICRRAG